MTGRHGGDLVTLVFPSPLLTALIHRGKVTNPSSVANMMDPVCCGHPIVRNNVGHVYQVAMPKSGDVSIDGKNRGAR